MNSMTQRARHLVTFALIGILCFQLPVQSFAQVGQTAMSQPQGVGNGVVNRGLGALGSLNEAGPGFFYYGVNGAGRGLGYFGSYMTLGGFIPYAQDDLGGFWSADLRTHLSTNGGFFSNVGVVRKQLTDNGSLLGFGLYWDYDGDMNQYAGTGDGVYGQFGHMYQQVGFSGEILTDRGAIRSNGYMPVGTTAYSVGAPGIPFEGHHWLCAYGLDAALGGADLEVGAWIPKLEAFGGMISVGGYTFGNINEWSQGTETGDRVVPFFGGVYTRFDITVANNWDINLQYNNDPFFDSTGFARLTYRMGGSRRRNVPDQLEQPLMRNEHIVRGHQTPQVCGNRVTGQPWKFIHVDNTAAAGGDGSYAAPFTNLADAETAATQEWDVVYVHTGNSQLALANAYGGEFTFQADNQFLAGSGGPLTLEVGSKCGTLINGNYLFTVPAQTPGINPRLSNPGGSSVSIDQTVAVAGATTGGTTTSYLDIVGSQTAINVLNNTNLNGTPQAWGTTANPYNSSLSKAGASSFRNVAVSNNGTNPSAEQRGIRIGSPGNGNTGGGIEFSDTSVSDMTRAGLIAQDNTNLNINFDGQITSDTANTGLVASPLVVIDSNSGTSNFSIAEGQPPAGASLTPNLLTDFGGEGIVISNNTANVTNLLGNVGLTDATGASIFVFNDGSTTTVAQDANTGIRRTSIPGAAIDVEDDGSGTIANPRFNYIGDIANSNEGYLLRVNGNNNRVGAPTPGSITVSGLTTTSLTDTDGEGILLTGVNANVNVDGALLSQSGAAGTTAGPLGISIQGGTGAFSFDNIQINTGTASSVLIQDMTAGTVSFSNLTIANPNVNAFGFRIDDNDSAISVGGTSNITTAATELSAIRTEGAKATVVDLQFVSVISENDTTSATWANPPYGAISVAANSVAATPDKIVASVFTKADGTPLTTANVQDNSGANVVKVP